MLGSSFSISGPNVILNTIVAEALCEFADKLEGQKDFAAALNALIKDTYKKHKRIIFNGNNYAAEWVTEANKRGLLNLKSTPEALPYFISDKNIALFNKHKVFTPGEMHSRYEIILEGYCKVLNIETLAMIDIVKKDIIPATCAYVKSISDTALSKKALLPNISCDVEESIVTTLSSLLSSLYSNLENLENVILQVKKYEDITECAKFYSTSIFPAMQELRCVADEIETLVAEEYWPFPTYGEILFCI